MIDRRSTWPAALALLAAGCGGADDQPLDGGWPLTFETNTEVIEMFAADPCARREKGGWHRSVGHCEPMLAARPISGVFITGMEESSFFEGDKAIPDGSDPRRFWTEIELDADRVKRRAGGAGSPRGASAYLLNFIGRRMRDPYLVGCDGTPAYMYVLDRLTAARYLGPAGKFDVEAVLARPVTVRRVHGGRWGEKEAEAVEQCSGRGPGPHADRIEDVVEGDQSPGQARPAGRGSAE